VPQLRRYSPTKLCDGAQMATFCPAFPASHTQHVSDLHYKLTLGPHHVTSMVDNQSTATEIRRGKKKKEETTGQKYNGVHYNIGQP